MPSFKRFLMGFAVYLLFAAAAAGVLIYAGLNEYFYPVLVIFILGYVGGRISKMIEQGR
jgi:hypothetical protein